MNRGIEQLAASRFRGAAAYVTTAIRVVTGALFVSFSTGKFVDHMKEAMLFLLWAGPGVLALDGKLAGAGGARSALPD